MYTSTKIIKGFSTCFRQEKAFPIFCSQIHGYSVSFEVEFETDTLDDRNWCIDFGFLKRSDYATTVSIEENLVLTLDQWFKYMFDHTVIVSENDSQLGWFKQGHKLGILQLRVVKEVGCEKFAELVWEQLQEFLDVTGKSKTVRLKKVTCRENENNSASFYE